MLIILNMIGNLLRLLTLYALYINGLLIIIIIIIWKSIWLAASSDPQEEFHPVYRSAIGIECASRG